MGKARKSNKEVKKQPAMTPKKRKAANRPRNTLPISFP